jgi:hypothetical protein
MQFNVNTLPHAKWSRDSELDNWFMLSHTTQRVFATSVGIWGFAIFIVNVNLKLDTLY